MLDDAYISLRYAVNFADGHGLVYNLGERVEGYTTFLWVIMLAGLARMGLDPVAACRALAIASGAAMVIVTALWARSLKVRLWPLAGLLTAIYPGTALWASSGMETCLFVAVIVAALWASTSGRVILAAALAGLCFWVRPDGGIVGVAILGAAMVREPRKRETWIACALWAAFILSLTAWRLWYYGQPVPNTFYAKVGDVPVSHTVFYFRTFALSAGGVLLLAFLAFPKRKRLEVYLFACLLIAYIVAVGGDVFQGSRFFLPLIPICAVATVDALSTRRIPASVAVGAATILSVYGWAHLGDLTEIYREMEISQYRESLEAPPGARVARVAIGVYGYHRRDVRVLDMVGLVSPEVARSWATEDGVKWPGHQRSNAEWILSQSPQWVYAGNLPLPCVLEMRKAIESRNDYEEIRPGVWRRISHGAKEM